MTACHDLDGLLAERASGPVPLPDQQRLDAHLESCQRCQAELSAYEATFAAVRSTPDSVPERARPAPKPKAEPRFVVPLRPRSAGPPLSDRVEGSSWRHDFAWATLARWRRVEYRRATRFALGIGFASVAAAAALVIAPAVFHRSPSRGGDAVWVTPWEPQVDAAVEASSLAYPYASDESDEAGPTDVALASLDASQP
jgi:anti-sigma factor RsiW